MDAGGGKDESSLPPGYVSLAMLQERWMREQRRTPEKKNLRGEKEEEEGKRGTASRFPNKSLGDRVLNDEGVKKLAGGSLRDHHPPGRVKNGGREIGLIEVKEKGKEIVVDGFEAGDAKKTEKKKKMKKKRPNFKLKKSEENGETRDGEKNENINGDRFDEADIVPKDDVKVGIGGVLSGKTNGSDQICGELKGVQGSEIVPTGAVVLPRNSVGEGQQIPNAKGRGHGGGFRGRGGFRRKGDNRGSGRGSGRHELKGAGVNSPLEKKMEGEKGCDEDQKGERFSIGRDGFHSVEDEVDAWKVNEVKADTENKVEYGISELTKGLRGLNGRDGNGLKRYGNGSWRGSTWGKIRSPTIDDGKVRNARSREESNGGYNGKCAYSKSVGGVWVKKGEGLGDPAAENGSSGISVDHQ